MDSPDDKEIAEFSVAGSFPSNHRAASTPNRSRIVSMNSVCGGNARIRDTRIPIWGLEAARQHGASDKTILEMYPVITGDDLLAAWQYVDSHRQEINQLIALNHGE